MKNYYNCIYVYINKINEKKYIGQAVNFNRRHNGHIRQSYNKNYGRNYDLPFHNAIRKYGIDNFEIKILKENLKSQCLLNFWECYYIDKFNTLTKNKKGYNVASGGSNGNVFEGKTKEEMSKTKEKMSKASKGRKHTEESREKMSKNHANFKGENHPAYGTTWNEERRKRTQETWKNKSKKEMNEFKRKISESNKGKIRSEEIKQKISNSQKIKIDQYTKNGIFIKTWDSIKEAKESLKIGSGISECCIYYEIGDKEWWDKYNKYPRKSIGGFIWKYHHEEIN